MSNVDHYVLYADVLGFKRLVTSNFVPFYDTLDFKGRPKLANLHFQDNPLSKAFRAFHRGIDAITNRTLLHGEKLFVFSDSLFFVSEKPGVCLRFAQRLLVEMVTNDVPIRMGVGFGSFVAHGFTHERTQDLEYTSLQFLGSGIVHATSAEKAVKGVRIAVHDTVLEALKKASPPAKEIDNLIGLPTMEQASCVRHEINYLRDLGKALKLTDTQVQQRRTKLRKHLVHMTGIAPQEAKVQIHYKQSIEAFDRMSMSA